MCCTQDLLFKGFSWGTPAARHQKRRRRKQLGFENAEGWFMILKGICLASAVLAVGFLAQAQDTIQLTGVGNGFTMGGVYVSPYTGTIDGVPTNIICDDFTTDISIGQSWSAFDNSLSSVTGAGPQKFTTPDYAGYTIQQEYTAAAILAVALMSPSIMNDSSQAGLYSFAIWTLFDPGATAGYGGNALSQTQINSVTSIRTNALAQAAGGAQPGAQVDIYTPNPTGASQEMLVVRTPESPVLASLGVELLTLLAAGYLLRNRASRALSFVRS
jgi:hypothetical protein